jgi:hypothetical protein
VWELRGIRKKSDKGRLRLCLGGHRISNIYYEVFRSYKKGNGILK